MKNLTEGNIFKNFLFCSIPLILAGILSQGYTIINTMIVGKLLGEAELAYIGSTASFIEVISAIIWGVGTGIALYIASLFGGEKFPKMINSIKINLIVLSLIAILISVISLVFYKPIFKMLEIGSDIYDGSLAYYSIYIVGFVFFSFNWCCVYIMNALGNTSFPLKMSILSCVLNIAGNILVIFLFESGIAAIAGVAAVSVVTAMLTGIGYIFRFSADFKKLGLSKQKLEFNYKDVSLAMRYGIPCMLQQIIMYVSSVCVQPVVNSLGSSAIAAYSVCLRIYGVNSTMFQNSSKSLSNYCAQCIGAKKTHMIKKGIRTGLVQSFMFAAPVMLLCMLLPKQITLLFFNDIASESAMYVQRYILICVPFIVCQIINNMFHNFFRGVMVPNVAMATTLIYSLVRIAATYILAPEYRMDGVYAGFIIAWIVETIISAAVFLSNKWKTAEYLGHEKL